MQHFHPNFQILEKLMPAHTQRACFVYAFQTNFDSEYDTYLIRGLYSGLTVINFTNRLCMSKIVVEDSQG